MAATSQLVSQEQAFLESFFVCLSQFAYDKAKEKMEREREHPTSSSPVWIQMVKALVNFVTAEKNYSCMAYLGVKNWFGRKDNLRSSYNAVMTDFRRVEDLGMKPDVSHDHRSSLERLLGHLCGQLVHFVTARLKLMDFYEQMATMGSMRFVNYDDLVLVITDIIQTYQKYFHHPILSQLKSTFSMECDLILQLHQAHIDLCTYQFLPCLLKLHEVYSKIGSLGCMQQTKESWKLSFSGSQSKQPTAPAYLLWLLKYKQVLLSKFSLYFHEILSKQAAGVGEMKSVLAKQSIDFYTKVSTFQKKSDASNICLVLDLHGIEDKYKGPGYHPPNKFTEPPKGLECYPAIFSCPPEKPSVHWPNVVMMINDRATELNNSDKPVYFYDNHFESTYFMTRIEPRITCVVIFGMKKAEKDSYVNNFMSEFCTQLRCTKVFSSLRPGSKG